MARTIRRIGCLAGVCLALAVWVGQPAAAAEVSADVVALLSDAGKIAIATEGSPQFGVEVYLAGSEGPRRTPSSTRVSGSR